MQAIQIFQLYYFELVETILILYLPIQKLLTYRIHEI
jgi:hypothetical protein